MNKRFGTAVRILILWALGVYCGTTSAEAAGPAIGGFVPFVGIGLTDEFKDFDDATFFLADVSDDPGGSFLGPGSSAYYDLAILDTGAATHILTHDAFLGFNIQAEGFRGTEIQQIGTAAGLIDLEINKPHGVYAAGLGDRVSAGSSLVMNNGAFRGQTSFAALSAPIEWTLPNIIGVPMAAQHAIAILNQAPQIFQYQGRTVRTPQVELRTLGSGGGGIVRRAPLKLRPGESFITGPLYTFTLGASFDIIASSPTVVPNGALFVDVDMAIGNRNFEDKEFLFDTGADLTVISEITAARLGFDPIFDTPDFFLEVESPGGVTTGVPGIFLDELNIDTVGGSFTLHNVPVAVLDLPSPNQPGNVIDGIIGMNLFNGRDLVIDANPATGQGGVGPSLYIGDPVADSRSWATMAASGTFSTVGNWSPGSNPDMLMWDASVAHVSGGDQTAVVAADASVFRLSVSGTSEAEMTVEVDNGATLTTFGETLIQQGGRIELAGGTLDTQFVNIDGGTLSGSGNVFAGTGPLQSPIRNLSGRIEPGTSIGELSIDGDLSNQANGTLAFDLGGITAVTTYDRLSVGRSAFLDGTLEVSLLNGFAPSLGSTFTILTAGTSVVGTFDTMSLPAGYLWSVTYNANNVVLAVTGFGLAGDYNDDGIVNAADYSVWRNSLGAVGSNLPADGNGNGSVDAGDYAIWKTHFGESLGSGSGGNSSTVPEPSSLMLVLLALSAWVTSRRRQPRRPLAV
jgi:hypothetical protein